LSCNALHLYVAAIQAQGGDMKRIRLFRMIVGMGLLLTPCLVQAETFSKASATFMQALHGQEGALVKAIEQFNQLSRREPDNPVYQAYLGACKTLQAREAWMPWNKMRYAEQGLEIIDRALNKLGPEDDKRTINGASRRLQTLLIAAQTYIGLPDDIFHRRAKGQRILKKMVTMPAFLTASQSFRKYILAMEMESK